MLHATVMSHRASYRSQASAELQVLSCLLSAQSSSLSSNLLPAIGLRLAAYIPVYAPVCVLVGYVSFCDRGAATTASTKRSLRAS